MVKSSLIDSNAEKPTRRNLNKDRERLSERKHSQMLCNSPNLAGIEPPEVGRNDQPRSKQAERNEYRKNWKRRLRREHPEQAEDTRLMNLYGVSFADKQAAYKEQNGICPLCSQPLPPIMSSNCCIDHKHGTRGKIRALLHRSCNVWLGYVEKHGMEVLNRASELLR